MKNIRREIELKYRLEGVEDYDAFCVWMGDPEEDWEQVNHFYQSPDGSIPGARGVIRIRLEKDTAVFTVKLGGPLARGLASSREYEEPWTGGRDVLPPPPEALWHVGHPGLSALAEEVGGNFPLVWAGQMVNRRKLYRLAGDLCLEVDASLYPDGARDYEVELETEAPERVRPRLTELLARSGVRFSAQSETKYQRFLRHRRHVRAGAP